MREIRTPGSVRGAPRKRGPYRDQPGSAFAGTIASTALSRGYQAATEKSTAGRRRETAEVCLVTRTGKGVCQVPGRAVRKARPADQTSQSILAPSWRGMATIHIALVLNS